MKNMTTKFLLVSAVSAAAVCAQAQQRVVAPAGQAYTIQSVAPANGTSVTYQWFRDGEVIANETGDSYTVPANLAKHPNGQPAYSGKTYSTVFQRVARSADCMGGVAMSNEVTVYFCELLVNGVCWARANTDAFNRISGNPWDLGSFYQWNRPNNYFDSTNPAAGVAISGWNATPNYDAEWTGGFPCPPGWRLPTRQDIQNLISGSTPVGGMWINNQARGLPSGVQGRLYGYNTSLCTMTDMSGCIFLPMVGNRSFSNGALGSNTTDGCYWSGEQYSSLIGYYLDFSNSVSTIVMSTKSYALSVRCVIDVQ